jgi:hypothetical protein
MAPRDPAAADARIVIPLRLRTTSYEPAPTPQILVPLPGSAVMAAAQRPDDDSGFPGVRRLHLNRLGRCPRAGLLTMPRLILFMFRVVLALWLLTGPWDGQG